MQSDIAFRKEAVSLLSNEIGVYVLCDLDDVPVYVGQTTEGIRTRVRKHLTAARSDIVASRQIDVWEIAWVRAYPESDKSRITLLENTLFHHFDPISPLMNARLPPRKLLDGPLPAPSQIIQVMSNEEIAFRRELINRYPRQLNHYSQIAEHYLYIKQNDAMARIMTVHLDRLNKYHSEVLAGFALAA